MPINKSLKYSLSRYMDLFFLCFIALVVCILLHPLFTNVGSEITAYLAFLKPNVLNVFNLLIGCLIWGVLIRLGGFRFKDIFSISTVRYPPLWLFALSDAFIYLFIIPGLFTGKQELQSQVELFGITSAFLALSAAITGMGFYLYKKATDVSSRDNANSKQASCDELSPLIVWLQQERPIENDNEDRFDLAPFARRIARHLYESPFKTIGITGPYGCGKSSIIRMVEQYRKNPEDLKRYLPPTHKIDSTQQIMTCYVAGWGLCKGSAAQHILNMAVKELSKHVDCLGLINLPNHYTSAVSELSSKWGKAIQSIIGSKKDPVEILNHLDRALIAINSRLVIYLEDLDRMEDASIFREEIAALLDRLKNLKNVSFVLAIEQEKGTIGILTRILDHIETVPVLPRDETMKNIWSFRKICFEMYKDDIYLLSAKERDERFGFYGSSDEQEPMLYRGFLGAERIHSSAEAVSRLLISPRLTKYALRRTYQTWRTLHGEIDFDDLLIVNVLRSTAPEAFAFLIDNIEPIRGIQERSGYRDDAKEKITKLESLWDNYTKNASWDKDAAKFLIDYMFGCWRVSHFHRRDLMQGVDRTNPTDYWVRFHAEEVSFGKIKDQEVLKAIEFYKNRYEKVYRDIGLPEAIFTVKGFAEKVEQFGIRLNSENVYDLAQELFGLILAQGHADIDTKDYNGFIELWGLYLNKGTANNDWLIKEIERALPIDLNFVNSIYYYWRHTSRVYQNSDHTAELRSAVIQKAKRIYEGNPDALIKALNPNFPYSIYQFAILFSSSEYGEAGFNPEEWVWLRELLLDAGKMSPQIIVPEIVWMFCKPPSMNGIYEFHKEQATSFFNDIMKDAMRLITKGIDTREMPEVNKSTIEFAQKEAENWLSTNL